MSVGVGLGVLGEMMEDEVDEVVGPRGRQDPERIAFRHGHEDGEVTLGGRRVQVGRPRMRVDEGSEVPLATYEYFADRDPLTRWCWSRCSLGSARAASADPEPVGEKCRGEGAFDVEVSGRREFIAAHARPEDADEP